MAGATVALPVLGLLLLPDLPLILELAERRAGSAGGTATALLWLAGNAGGIGVALIIQGLQGSAAVAFGTLAAGGVIALPLSLALRGQLMRGQRPGEPNGGRPAPTVDTSPGSIGR